MKKNRLLALAALVVLTAPMQPAHSSDSKMIDFILGQTERVGRNQCTAAVKEAFQFVSGSDVRVLIDGVPGIDSFKVTAVYGVNGDTIFQGVDFTVLDGRCFYSSTSMVYTQRTCRAHLAKYDNFSLSAETLGVLFATNPGGVDMIMSPSDHGGCTVVYGGNGLK